MTFVILDGNVKASWLSAIAAPAAPTTTELNAGTSLELRLTPDGLNIDVTTGSVNVSALGRKYTHARAGRFGVSIMLKIHHDDTADTPFTVLAPNTIGFLVVRRGLARTVAWTTSQKVEVYPCEVGGRNEANPAENSAWDGEVPLFMYDDAQPAAVVA